MKRNLTSSGCAPKGDGKFQQKSFRFFQGSGAKRKPRQPTRQELRSVDRALPPGTYWREEVLAGREEYPPPGANPAPRACQHASDAGRLYPHYYVIRQGKTPLSARSERVRGAICVDCINNEILERQLQRYREESRRDPQATSGSHEVSVMLGAADGSPSAAAIMALGNAVCRDEEGEAHEVRLIELPLATEDVGQLRRQIARYLAGKPTSLLKSL